jgi:hypothetical protein
MTGLSVATTAFLTKALSTAELATTVTALQNLRTFHTANHRRMIERMTGQGARVTTWKIWLIAFSIASTNASIPLNRRLNYDFVAVFSTGNWEAVIHIESFQRLLAHESE